MNFGEGEEEEKDGRSPPPLLASPEDKWRKSGRRVF